jgi:hypothetical protein
MKKEKKIYLSLWVTPDIKKWLIECAKKNDRSLSGETTFLLKKIMRQAGAMK